MASDVSRTFWSRTSPPSTPSTVATAEKRALMSTPPAAQSDKGFSTSTSSDTTTPAPSGQRTPPPTAANPSTKAHPQSSEPATSGPRRGAIAWHPARLRRIGSMGSPPPAQSFPNALPRPRPSGPAAVPAAPPPS
eukprot:CAMPEP_0185747958 /NCGR_PEP_ID=MMETSP1174-20130828/6611_1 /TAXON_ID=35687 /ORGANISM="Dictyocha speculum, Strain CCMP1381" /LENGTH=134 /DNA_ID=CAMNT_0028423399 /DNA_START=513 /DNA_END=914 /DNA_ORIENTATION=+